MARTWLVVMVGVVLLGACSGSDDPVPFAAEVAAAGPVDGVTSIPASTASVPPPTTAAPTTTAPPPPPTTASPAPTFSSSVSAVSADELGVSWRPGCPVPVEDLRWVELSHWNDAGGVETGALVLHADHADAVVTAFERVFAAGFPIHSMRPITEFDGDDDASMTANNTSAFNCREIAGRPGVWSQHAYGGAIDINPLVNPWVRGSTVDPPEASAFVDRDASVTGLIVAGDVVTEAFAAIGWGWGGDWSRTLDYQHFSHNGR